MSGAVIRKGDVFTADIAADLLDEYCEDYKFFFASPQGTLLAQGAHARVLSDVDDTELDGIPGRVQHALDWAASSGHPRPVVVGAVPFKGSVPARLVVAKTIRSAAPLSFDRPIPAASEPVAECHLRQIPEPAEYMRGVERALDRIRAGEIGKVVLSRTMELTAPTPIDVPQLLQSLARRNPHGYTYAVDVSQPGVDPRSTAQRRILVGASPELLLSKSGGQIVANPLAGSAARSADPIEDRRRAEALRASAKDRHEHAVVIDAVAAALRPFCRELHVPAVPSVVHTQTMWHLSTRVEGELLDPAMSSLTLALALHPTPAVCGHPTERARQVIEEIEPFDRGFFTGTVGWCDASGDGEWAVTIRCAEVSGERLRLFAGAGIVAASKPEDELAETSAKFRTMLNALGLAQAVERLA